MSGTQESAERFDEAYYQRYYESKETRVYGKESIAHLARGVTGMIAWYGGTLRSILDVGAGTGLWRDWFAAHASANKKAIRYLSTEISEHACKKYGHKRCDISIWRTREQFDLIICQGVLPYLDDDGATRAIENIAAMSRGFLYLEAVTKRDLEEVCDRDFTDTTQRARSARWYRTRLDRHFTPLGCGLYYSKKGPLTFYELEKA
ncbi:methyltransferase domain-containing protein [Pendulispora albinea]|uniref:Class I SAM-dependent methyltransferase n=1 Tax=Pendulispora albinea TaxID=2741071 RepID=A0ABZ2LJB7_9BACT